MSDMNIAAVRSTNYAHMQAATASTVKESNQTENTHNSAYAAEINHAISKIDANLDAGNEVTDEAVEEMSASLSERLNDQQKDQFKAFTSEVKAAVAQVRAEQPLPSQPTKADVQASNNALNTLVPTLMPGMSGSMINDSSDVTNFLEASGDGQLSDAKILFLLVSILTEKGKNVSAVAKSMKVSSDLSKSLRNETAPFQNLTQPVTIGGKQIDNMQDLFKLAYGTPPNKTALEAVKGFEPYLKDIIGTTDGHGKGDSLFETLKANGFNDTEMFNDMFIQHIHNYEGVARAASNSPEMSVSMPWKEDDKGNKFLSCASTEMNKILTVGTNAMTTAGAINQELQASFSEVVSQHATAGNSLKTFSEKLDALRNTLSRA